MLKNMYGSWLTDNEVTLSNCCCQVESCQNREVHILQSYAKNNVNNSGVLHQFTYNVNLYTSFFQVTRTDHPNGG